MRSSQWTLDADFEGGNILLESQSDLSANVRQNWASSSAWWFFWAFRVRGAQNRTLRFNFLDGDVFAANGPCVSNDGRGNWVWLGTDSVKSNGFSYCFCEEDDVIFAFCPLYTRYELDAFLDRNSMMTRRTIGVTRVGCPLELFNFASATPRFRTLLLARTHACESMASSVVEGISKWWQRDDFLRENADLEVVPFLDPDGVERGEQGKGRTPHDHNQDWTCEPLYPETRAVMRHIEADPQFDVVLDFHCPWLRDGRNEQLFFFDARPDDVSGLRDFAAILESTARWVGFPSELNSRGVRPIQFRRHANRDQLVRTKHFGPNLCSS